MTHHIRFSPTGSLCPLKSNSAITERLYSYFHFIVLFTARLKGSFGVRDVVFPLQVIAIVTDRLTDCAVIGDLHSAASRGVAIYIILNQRSIQETFTLKKLRHPVSHIQLKRPCKHSNPGRNVNKKLEVIANL